LVLKRFEPHHSLEIQDRSIQDFLNATLKPRVGCGALGAGWDILFDAYFREILLRDLSITPFWWILVIFTQQNQWCFFEA
jgi:hypothetical protein